MSFKYNSIASILAMMLLLMVLVPTTAISWMAYSMMYDTIRSSRIKDVGMMAGIKHEQLVNILMHANIGAKSLLSDIISQCGGEAANHVCALALIKSYLAAADAIGATLYENGKTLTIGISTNPGNTIFKSGQLAGFSGKGEVNDRRYFIQVIDEATGRRLEVTYPISKFETVFKHHLAELGHSGEVFLADGEGYFASKHRYFATQGHEHPISARPMQTCLSGQSGEALDLDYRGIKIIHGFHFIPELGQACIMAHIDQEEAFAPLKLLQQRTFILAFLFLVLLIILTAFLARRIVRPVIQLTRIAHAIAEGNLQVRADVKGNNEIAELAYTFNHMTCRLQDSQQQLLRNEAELKQLNTELEQRVKERTRQLEIVNEELESFNYSVAHDLRAPLRSINGFSRVLSNKYCKQLDATALDWLERICRASQHMGHLIDDILRLSQVTRSQLKIEQLDLSNIAENVVDDLKKADPERQVRIVIQQGLQVQADPVLLQVVLDNLLGNAFKFTGKIKDAEIEFGACDIDGQRTFFVRDNGDGFDMEYAHKLFGAFQRLHSAIEFDGTGIGLATVQRVIHRHNGKVWAEGRKGQGATFYFTLPQPQRIVKHQEAG